MEWQMKKEKREIYLVLVSLINWTLCPFCKYAEHSAASCCECPDPPECHHPIDNVPGCWGPMDPGQDCWGYRPSNDVGFIAGVVGVVLEQGWSSATWWVNKDGIHKIAGVK